MYVKIFLRIFRIFIACMRGCHDATVVVLLSESNIPQVLKKNGNLYQLQRDGVRGDAQEAEGEGEDFA